MNATIQKEAGLYTQIHTLRKRIDSLDMSKVNPSELKSAIDSLKDLEVRYADMQEKKKQRSIEKQNREKELATQTVVSEEAKPETVPVEAAPGGMLSAIPLPVDQQVIDPAAVAATPVDASVEAPAVTAEAAPEVTPAPTPEPEKKVEVPKPEEKLDKMDLTKDPEFDSMIASALYMKMLDYLIMADDPQYDTIVKFKRAIERVQNEEDREKLKACFNKEFAVNQQTPWDYYAEGQKATPKETEIKPEATTDKHADVSKFALDDLVEPVYGTAGSYGRVMRYDADKDMAYVHWDTGKLAADHGFGAYKGSDLRKRAAKEVTDKVRCNNCYGVYDEDITECPKCKTDKYLMQPFMHNDKEAEASREISYEKCSCGHMKFDHETDDGKTKCDECKCTNFVKRAFLKRGKFVLKYNGEVRGEGASYNEMLMKLHRIQDLSWDRAMKSGWSIVEEKEASLKVEGRVVHEKDGWHVLSEEGKNLGGPYDSKEKAVKRLRQVEYFKHHKSSLDKNADLFDTYTHYLLEQYIDKYGDPKTDLQFTYDGRAYQYGLTGEEGTKFAPVGVPFKQWEKSYNKSLKEAPPVVDPELMHELIDQEKNKSTWTEPYRPKISQKEKRAEGDGMGYGGDRPGMAVAPKRDEDVSLNAAEPTGTMELNIANRKWTAKRTSGKPGVPDAWVIFDDQGQQIMAITMKDHELSQPEIEQIVFNELGNRDLVRATLKTNLSVLKKGHKVKIVSIDVKRKEAKFASLEMKSVTGWTSFDRFDFEIVADRKPHLDQKCKECGAVVPMTYSEEVLCRDCKRKKEKKDHEASLMPLSKTDKIVRIKSVKVLNDLAKDCPDCYKKFLKFAKEKGLRIQADDLTDHVEQMRTKMTQTKEVLQTQTQAADVAPETVETEAALPPKPSVTLPQGMKWMFNIDSNTWDMVADTQFTY
jgi:hypothetical protein